MTGAPSPAVCVSIVAGVCYSGRCCIAYRNPARVSTSERANSRMSRYVMLCSFVNTLFIMERQFSALHFAKPIFARIVGPMLRQF